MRRILNFILSFFVRLLALVLIPVVLPILAIIVVTVCFGGGLASSVLIKFKRYFFANDVDLILPKYSSIQDYLESSNIVLPRRSFVKSFLGIIYLFIFLFLTTRFKDLGYLFLFIFIPVCALFSLSVGSKAIVHCFHYHRWLHLCRNNVDYELDLLRTNNEDEWIDVLGLIGTGKTRTIMIKYPDLYKRLQIPHLWYSLFGTRMAALSSFFMLVIFIMVYFLFFSEIYNGAHIAYDSFLHFLYRLSLPDFIGIVLGQ